MADKAISITRSVTTPGRYVLTITTRHGMGMVSTNTYASYKTRDAAIAAAKKMGHRLVQCDY